MSRGVVTKVMADRGFGFIKELRNGEKPTEDLRGDIFFHCSGFTRLEDFEGIQVGSLVQFTKFRTDDDRKRAKDISILPT